MKLGNLNSAIRSLKGAPRTIAKITLPSGERVTLGEGLEITKQSLLEALKKSFPEGRSAETGLKLSDSGFIEMEDASAPVQAWIDPDAAEADEPAVDETDADDLLG